MISSPTACYQNCCPAEAGIAAETRLRASSSEDLEGVHGRGHWGVLLRVGAFLVAYGVDVDDLSRWGSARRLR
jgi:hypothetical protein